MNTKFSGENTDSCPLYNGKVNSPFSFYCACMVFIVQNFNFFKNPKLSPPTKMAEVHP